MKDLVNEIFEESLNLFFSEEANNIASGVSERNLCGRLAMILQTTAHNKGLTRYYADPEYNRKQGGKIKTILDDNLEVIVINCDLILHSRGEIVKRDNIIAIEMKKHNRPEQEKVSDRARLRAMTKASYDDIWSYDGITLPKHVCGYELGVFIELDNSERKFRTETFRSGKLINAIDGSF